MSTPYWGQLPPPKTAQTRARRLSDDLGPEEHRPSLDAPSQGPSRSNRVSVQTTKSDALTESTLSPFASPTASSFQGQGLTPRPPSFPYGANQYPPELLENRRRRKSRNQEQDDDYAAVTGPPPPAAPDAPPRPPPSSSRHRPTSGGPPHPYATPPQGIGRPSRRMDDDAASPSGPARNTLDESAMPRPQRVATDPTLGRNSPLANGRRRSSAAEQSLQRSARRTSASSSSDRPKPFADVRSPLQRLELTLDSITKEERRARVEAAERAAREKSAVKGATPQADKTPQQVRFRERRPSVTAGDAPSAPITPTRPAQYASAQNGPLSQNPPESARQSSAARPSPRAAAPDSRIPVPAQASGTPQRNLSFRERAARNDVPLPNGLGSPVTPTAAPSRPTPPRSGGKLTKNPPNNLWPNRISESDEIHHAGEVAVRSPQVVSGPAPVTPQAANPPPQHQFEAPASGPPLRDTNLLDDDFADEFMAYPPSGKLTKASPSQRKADQILGRVPSQSAATAAANGSRQGAVFTALTSPAAAAAAAPPPYPPAATSGLQAVPHGDHTDIIDASGQRHHVSDLLYHAREKFQPGEGIFKPSTFLEEWKGANVGALTGGLLDLEDVPPAVEKNTTWWENSTPQSRRRSTSLSSRPKKAEAFEGEYDENAPTRFKPPLYLKCGPLLRFCGIRHERVPQRSTRTGAVVDKEVWRGSIMIVTTDADSSYDINPILRLFVQPLELLPPPPREIQGGDLLAPEYVDPIAGHPKLGRKGETLYVRPVDHLDEAKDVSRDETDGGLFEKTKSPPDAPLPEGATDPTGSFAARRKRAEMDGEKAGKYKDVRGFRLHAERGYTFWRFNIEVELRDTQQRIAYRINRGPSTGFWVPARGQSMNIMFHSCNGFSMNVDSDTFSGPDPMWRDVLNTHQSQPFHVMIGGGDQIYNDRCMQDTTIFKEWLMIKNPLHKHNAPFTPEMQDELERFYLERYSMWFSQGLFGMANSQIPMVNMYDDHDIIDGFGSYPHHFMNSPVFSGLGNVAFKYYMLFQHQSVAAETEKTEPSWVLGTQPGPYINELSRSLFMFLGGKIALLAVDARTERTRGEVIREDTWKKIIDRCYGEIDKGKVEHLLVLLGVPIAYPRLVWLENILTSRVMDPVKALAKLGMFGGLLNRFDGGVEVLDDLDDHWTAKNHKHERSIVLEDLQDLAADKSIRVTILSGDVHLAAIGQFYSNPKLGLAKHKDFRYIPNVISSAIVNTPPPDLLADVLNKRNKVHHFDKETDEDMIPLFAHGVDGKPRNNKHLLPHRNWCAIREYVPGHTPPPTPSHSAFDLDLPGRRRSASVSGIFRRLSLSRSKTALADGAGPPPPPKDRTRPPLSKGAGLLRSLSRRKGAASADQVVAVGAAGPGGKPPGRLTRTLSGSAVSGRFGGLFRRRSGTEKRDDGGINGTWGPETDEDDDEVVQQGQGQQWSAGGRAVGMRGGLGPQHQHGEARGYGNGEFDQGDERYFSAIRPPPVPPKPTTTINHNHNAASHQHDDDTDAEFIPGPFHRTPTTLTTRQRKAGQEEFAVDLRGAIEVTLNVEISPRDPGGSTVPYRLVVPKLWYEYEGEEGGHGRVAGGQGVAVAGQPEGNAVVGVSGAEGNAVAAFPEGKGEVVGPVEQKKGIKRLLSLRRGKSENLG